MKNTEKLDGLEFNEVIETDNLLPGLKEIVGEKVKFVGKSYIFEGSNGVLQEVKLWAKGFDPEKYDLPKD